MLEKLKKRFTSDFNYPISVFEDEVWDFLIKLYGIESEWNNLLEGIKKEYSSADCFLEDFYKSREFILQSFKSKPEFLEFNGDTGKKFIESLTKEIIPGIRKDDIYNESFVGKNYLSLDLKKANMQAFYQFNNKIFCDEPMNNADEYYTRWIQSYIDKDKTLLREYIPKSKYLRQVIFGNCNPSRQISIERGLVSRIGKYILNNFGYPIVMLGSDEVIFEVPKYRDYDYTGLVKLNLGLIVTQSYFRLGIHKFNTGSHTLNIFSREDPISGKVKYKGIPKQYYAQVFELLNHIEPDLEKDRDLVFYNDNEPAKFLNRLTEIK